MLIGVHSEGSKLIQGYIKLGFFGLFGKKKPSDAEPQVNSKYAAFGEAAQADIQNFSRHLAKDWQYIVNHRNFERTPFELQVRLFLERHEHELGHGKFPHTHALVKAGKLDFNTLAYDTMMHAVRTISELKLLDGFDKAGRKVS